MYLFYNIILITLFPVYLFLSKFFPKIRETARRRSDDLIRIRNFKFSKQNKTVIWLHSASVGELDQARALAKIIKEKNKSSFILISIFSNSVTEIHLEDPLFDVHFLLPFDFPFAYREIISKFSPDYLVIMSWDTWPNLIRNLKQFGAKTFLACASLSTSSGRNRGLMKRLTKASFNYLDGIFPSHEILIDHFRNLVSPPTILEALGDTRIDAVLTRINSTKPPESFQLFTRRFQSEIESKKPILFGSTYPICESYLLDYLQTRQRSGNVNDDSFWIFPHKWNKVRMQDFESRLQAYGSVNSYSKILSEHLPLPQFVLIDEMGILAFAYKYARFAYIGGGFHFRIHNTIEPAAFGLALITGPKIFNAPEALVMQKLGGLLASSGKEEFLNQIAALAKNPEETEQIGQKNRNFVLENRGASERIYLRVFSNAHR